jgi:hypothetical protein
MGVLRSGLLACSPRACLPASPHEPAMAAPTQLHASCSPAPNHFLLRNQPPPNRSFVFSDSACPSPCLSPSLCPASRVTSINLASLASFHLQAPGTPGPNAPTSTSEAAVSWQLQGTLRQGMAPCTACSAPENGAGLLPDTALQPAWQPPPLPSAPPHTHPTHPHSLSRCNRSDVGGNASLSLSFCTHPSFLPP